MSRTGSRQEMAAFRDYGHHNPYNHHHHRNNSGSPQMVVGGGGAGGAHHSLMRGQKTHMDVLSSGRRSPMYSSHPQLTGSNPQLYRAGNQVTGGSGGGGSSGGGSHPPSLNGFPQGPGPSRQPVLVGHHPHVNGGHPNVNGGHPHINGGHPHMNGGHPPMNGGHQPGPAGFPGSRPPPLESEQNRALREAFRKEMKLESYLADDLNFPDFANKLKEQGLQLRDIPADGNCLFRALGDQLEGHCRSHYRHRQEVVGYIVDHRKDFEPFLEDEVPFETHVSNLKKLGTHAGNDAIVAFARLHNVNVFIHQLKGDPIQISAPSSNVNVRQVHIAYHNGDHYSSIRLLGDNTESPANVRIQKSEKLPAPVAAQGPEDGGKGVVTAKREVSHLEDEVCRATGCQDTAAVHKALKLNAYDVDATIASLMHSLELGGTQGGDDTTSVGSHQTTDSGIFASTHVTEAGSSTGSVKGKGHKVHFREDSFGGSSGYSSMGSNRGGGRPKLFIPQAPVQYIVTGKKAKELKKLQKHLKYI